MGSLCQCLCKNKTTGEWYEIGRFITPYWVGTEKLPRGLEIDVTDFKSLLSGNTELKIYTETWLAKGREYSVDFDIVYGTPDYKYSAVVPVVQYNKSSIDGVPYGKAHTLALKRISSYQQTQKKLILELLFLDGDMLSHMMREAEVVQNGASEHTL